MSKFLFNFVKILTNREKAYFKRYINIHSKSEDKNYLKLYEATEKMETYRKGALEGVFEGTSIEKHFSSEISYLKDKILSSLFNFNLNNSKKNKILKGILFIETLIDKGFRKEAMKKLKYTKKIAYQMEEFTWILKLIELEETILFKEGIIGFKDTLKRLREERHKITDIIQNLNEMHILRQEIRELQFSERFVTDNFKKYKHLYANPLIEKEQNCKSKKATEHWHYIQVVKNYLVRDYPSGVAASVKYLQFVEQNEHLFLTNKKLPLLSNYIYLSALSKDKAQAQIGIEKLSELLKEDKIDAVYYWYIVYTRQLEIAYHTDDNELMDNYLDKNIEFLEGNIEQLGSVQIQYLFSLITRSCIYLRKFEIGAVQVNRWLQQGTLAVELLQARLFALIIHYELNWMQLVQSEIILLKKLKKDFPRERELISSFYAFFDKCIKYPTKKAKHIATFQKQLYAIYEDKESNFDFGILNFYKWSLLLSETNE